MTPQPPTPATLRRYGLTAADWLAILDRQGGVCAVCERVPESGRFVTDHDHVKGWKRMSPAGRRLHVRGILCGWCNGRHVDRSITLQKARNVVAYLEAHAAKLAEVRKVLAGSEDAGGLFV